MNDPVQVPPRGLPEFLPAGEELLWQGAPDWRVFARQALHARGIALYFAMMLAWRIVSDWSDGAAIVDIAISGTRFLAFAAVAMGVIYAIAWLTTRTTVYSLTNRRIVMRIGIALPVTFNIPFSAIETVRMSERSDGSGDLPLVLTGPQRIAYLHLVPHARPWRLSRPEPMLRAIKDVRKVGALVASAMAVMSDTKRTELQSTPDARQAARTPRRLSMSPAIEETPA